MSSDAKVVHLVDDDRAVRRSVAFMLNTSGHRVESYESGLELLKTARKLEDGCILLDIRMPGMDGLEVQQALHDRGVPMPVIIMTGHGDVGLAVKAMRAGAVDFIEKPFAKETLLASLAEAFSRLSRQEAARDRQKDAEVRLQLLTMREHQVLDGLARGLPNKTIAYDLGISPRTVEIHRANLMGKLGARSLSEALRIAFAAHGE
jgi:two-component system response regulator FixJ